ncbi:MAG: hypothetical protein RI566_04400 [Sediminimonas sp.]|uniref:hypothetical protein n=1 Tax=Sediminimonas sp. TaxID=2823379 RepID=UPI0028709CD7|nr:hypothetical protein [Sediminimonas sp.]MDR9484392.1 hypothetical protein [Sediminimonas sp.]
MGVDCTLFTRRIETGKRPRLNDATAKTPQIALGGTPPQGDYATKWNEHETLREGWA